MEKYNQIMVELIYATPQEQEIITIEVEQGVNVGQAIHQSGILTNYPEIDLDAVKVGIFGKVAKLDRVLEARDRIEIYRTLIADPKQARKNRAAKASADKKSAATQS